MKTIEEIGMEVIKETGQICRMSPIEVEVCKRYAIEVSRAALENAAKNVKTFQQFTGTTNITQVDKSSITSENNIPKL